MSFELVDVILLLLTNAKIQLHVEHILIIVKLK